MAHLHLHHNNKLRFLESVGEKVKTLGQIAGSIKTIYDVGRDLAPVIAGAATVLL